MKGKRRLGLGGIVAVGALGWLLLAPHAWAAGSAAPDAQAATPDVGTLLGPLLAAATGIERVIEMFWNFVESTAQQGLAALGLGQSWARYAGAQVRAAEESLNSLAAQAEALRRKGAAPADPLAVTALDQQIDLAQRKLGDAQQQLTNALHSPRYTSIKQAASVLIGIALGLVVAFATQLDMFQLLRLANGPGAVGIFLTGLIIGAGSGPVHSIIGLLQQSKDAVDQAANLFSARSRRNATEALSNLMAANATSAAGAAERGLAGAPRDLAPAEGAPPVAAVTAEQIRLVERLATR
jgi:hypothetical protein